MSTLKFILKWGFIGFAVFFVSFVAINIWVYRSGAGRVFFDPDEVPEGRIGLLLGTSKKVAGGSPNLFFTHRIQAALQLYNSGHIRKVIVSGDNGKANYNETEDMRRELIRLGIPESAIINDHAGFRTLDSVVRSKSVFGQDKIVVISQEFHVRRAIFIARAHDIDAVGYVAKDPPENWSANSVYVRETFARAKAFLDCYILGTQPRFNGPPEPIDMN